LFNAKWIFVFQELDLTDLKLDFTFFFFVKTHLDFILSHGLEELSNGCPDLYNAAGKL
jgi:hypothetical protein